MSSPVTFSGFNNIDFNAVVTALMNQASQPLTTLQTQQKNLQSQVSKYDTLVGHITALRSAADDLGSASSLTLVSGTSAQPQSVAISTGTGATPASYDVIVNELARAQLTISASTAPDATTTIVAQGGTLTIGDTTVTVAGDVTLQGLADAINGTAGIDVHAAVIRTAPGTYRLALTGTNMGQANAFTVANGLTGGTGVTFTDTDNNGLAGDTAADNALNASDASLLINNIPVTGDSNTFQDVLPGVTITALKKDPAATVTLTVATDGEALKSKITDFITAYNNLQKFISEQRTASAGGDGTSIGRDPVIRQVYNDLRSALLGAHGTGTLTRLAEAGIEFTSSGQLKLNESMFNAAIASNPDDVRQLFGGTGGAFPAVESMLDSFVQADGSVPSSKKRVQNQITSMNTQIQALQDRLALQRESLQRQFAEADLAMQRLNSQTSSLDNLANIWGAL